MNKEKINHVFFDLDNTLWDHRGNSERTLQKMFDQYKIQEEYNISFAEWHTVFYEKNEILWAQLRDQEIDKQYLRNHRFRDSFEHFGIYNSDLNESFESNYLKNMTQEKGLVEGAVELLNYLKPKYKLHVITNGFIEVSYQKIETSELNGFFETLTCADEVGVRKPNPKIFTLAMDKADAQPTESVLIGDDWIADIVGGDSFGMNVIFLNRLGEVHNELPNVPQVEELVQIKKIL